MDRLLIAMFIAIPFFFSCKTKEKKTVVAAKVENQVKETDLTKIVLTSDAKRRLGIQTVLAKTEYISRVQVFSGEIMGVPGTSVTITAPVAGTILAPAGNDMPRVGMNVAKGQELFRMLILPTEKDLLSAREDVKQKSVQAEVSRQKVHRTTELYREGAGSLKAKQEADAELAANEAALRVARSRVELLAGRSPVSLAERISTLHVKSSVSGIVQRMYVSSSQIVALGAPVYDIVAFDPVWVRIPVYAGDIEKINGGINATVKSLSDFHNETTNLIARPVPGLQNADAPSSSVFIYYEVINNRGRYLPGQRVSVSVPLKDFQSSLVVPFSAVVYDIQGGTWVYENTDSLSYIRRRVEIEHVYDDIAVIKRGIPENTRIVTVGAAELFGTEFGGGK